MSDPVLTLEQAATLAARTLAAIDEHTKYTTDAVRDYCRERVASDLAGLRQHRGDDDWWCPVCRFGESCLDADRYWAGLRRTAALYGVTV